LKGTTEQIAIGYETRCMSF